MASWKAIEREVARLVGGERTWFSLEDIDVETETAAIEVKNLTAPSLAQLEKYLAHNQPKADKVGKTNVLVVKRKAGRGSKTPFVALFLLEPSTDLSQPNTTQEDA